MAYETASAAAPSRSCFAFLASEVRAGMWKPYARAKSSCLSVPSTHSHFTNALASARCLLRALTAEPYAPTGTAGFPAPSSGNGSTPKSSPSAFLTCGSAHRPDHCMAVSPCTKAAGSDQSVGAPSSNDSSAYSCRIFPRTRAAAGSSKPTFPSSVIRLSPAANSGVPPSTAAPPSFPRNSPLTLSFRCRAVSVLAASTSSSTLRGGSTPAAFSRLFR